MKDVEQIDRVSESSQVIDRRIAGYGLTLPDPALAAKPKLTQEPGPASAGSQAPTRV